MSQTIAIQRIKQCLRTKSNVLDLSNLGLTELPREIKQLAAQLFALRIEENLIEDVSFLSQLINLTTLDAFNNVIEDISPLRTLTRLNSLDLANNLISNISLLSALKKLKYLNLNNNQISDISVISNYLTDLSQYIFHFFLQLDFCS